MLHNINKNTPESDEPGDGLTGTKSLADYVASVVHINCAEGWLDDVGQRDGKNGRGREGVGRDDDCDGDRQVAHACGVH